MTFPNAGPSHDVWFRVPSRGVSGSNPVVSSRLALLAALAAAPLVLGVAGSSVAARRIAPCRPAHVTFSVQRQPINSVTTGFSAIAKTRIRVFRAPCRATRR